MANVRDVARFFIDLGEKQYEAGIGDLVTPLRLQKLLYFAQGWFLARYGRPLFNARIEAWEHGPVVPEVYNAYRHLKGNGITSAGMPDESCFSEEEISTLIDVAAEYDKHSTWALVDMTHEPDTPWAATAWNDTISTEKIRAYFSAKPKLKSLKDALASFDAEHTITPVRYEDGVAILPKDAREKLGVWDA